MCILTASTKRRTLYPVVSKATSDDLGYNSKLRETLRRYMPLESCIPAAEFHGEYVIDSFKITDVLS